MIICIVGGGTPNLVNLLRICDFLKMDYLIMSNFLQLQENLKTVNKCIVITSDLLITPELLKLLVEDDGYHITPIKFRRLNQEWVPSFCGIVKGDDFDYNNPRDYYNISPGIASETMHDRFNDISGTLSSYWNTMMNLYWNVSTVLGQKILIPLWVDAFHKHYMSKDLDTVNIDNINHYRNQSLYGCPYNRKKIDVSSPEEIKSLVFSTKHDFESLLSGSAKGYEIEVEMNPEEFNRHPLSIEGIVSIKPTIIKTFINKSVTLIGFFFDIKMSGKNATIYHKSFTEYAKLPYPLVFYGDANTCKIMRNARKEAGFEEFTTTYTRPLEEWELSKKYPYLLSADKNPCITKDPKYSLLTCLKPYIVMDAIENNPYGNNKFIYFDAGIYKYKHINIPKLVGVDIFRNIATNPHGIVIPSQSYIPYSSEEDIQKSVQHVMAWFMLGTIESWYKFFEPYDILVNELFKREMPRTEQVVINRVATNFPERVSPLFMGMSGSQIYKALIG